MGAPHRDLAELREHKDRMRRSETTLPPMLGKDMKRNLRNAGDKVRVAVRYRDEAIRAAVEAGGSYREVGEAVGMSHTAIKFIAKGRP